MYLDGESQEFFRDFVCNYHRSGAGYVAESCVSPEFEIENRYWFGRRSGKIVKSRQWIGPKQGYMSLERLS